MLVDPFGPISDLSKEPWPQQLPPQRFALTAEQVMAGERAAPAVKMVTMLAHEIRHRVLKDMQDGGRSAILSERGTGYATTSITYLPVIGGVAFRVVVELDA